MRTKVAAVRGLSTCVSWALECCISSCGRLHYSWAVLLTWTPYILRGVPVKLRFGPRLLPLCPAPFPLRSVGYPVFMEGDLYIFQQNVDLDTQLLLLDCATYLKLIPPASGGHPHHHLQIFISLPPLSLGTTCGLGSQG